MTADDLIGRLRELRVEYGDLPLAFCPLPGPTYTYMEGVEPAKDEPDFYDGRECFVISYVPR